MEQNSFLWQVFIDTGEIDAYLMYKDMENLKNSREEDAKWQTSEPKV